MAKISLRNFRITDEIKKQELSNVFDNLLDIENLLEWKQYSVHPQTEVIDSHISNYIVIRLVTILEQFCRQIVEHQIKKHPEYILISQTIEIRTDALDKIEDMSKARLISISYNFQNAENIECYLSKYNIKNIWNNNNMHLKNELDKLTSCRHNIVHTVSPITYDAKHGYDVVKSFIKHLCEITFKDRGFYYKKGLALARRKKFHNAVACFDKAITLYPTSGILYRAKGFALQDLDKNLDAVACFDKAIELGIKDVHMYVHKGFALQDLDKNLDAVACFDKAITLYPTSSNLYYNKGLTLWYLNKNLDAVACFDKAIELDPTSGVLYRAKGFALQDLDKNLDAIKCFDEAIKLVPSDPITYRFKGNVLYKLGRYNEAKMCHLKSEELEEFAKTINIPIL